MKDRAELRKELMEDMHIKSIGESVMKLSAKGIKNVKFRSTLARGFDYYTGAVFEVFDTNPKNPRSVLGGGRYDDLVGIFGVEKVFGIGFGAGDVTTRDFLETYGLLPEYKPPVQLYICHLENYLSAAEELAADLRKQGLNVSVDLTDRKVSAQVKTADKEKIPFVLVIGEEEATLAASRLLADEGYLAAAIRPPTVPAGTARLRLTFTAQHPDDAIARLADIVRDKILVN